jgi:ATP-dependent RNA helicase DDX52/ROK1
LNEADNAVRKHYRIKVSGYDPAPPLRSFKQLVTKHAVPSGLVRILHKSGFDQPTPIQRQAVPVLLAKRELLAVAPTGSGKTLVSAAVPDIP